MNKDNLKNLFLQTALDYIKLYNLQGSDVLVLNGYIQELLSKFGIEED